MNTRFRVHPAQRRGPGTRSRAVVFTVTVRRVLAIFGMLGVVASAASAPALATARPLVVCLGDSLTEGYGLGEAEGYPALVQELLRQQGWPGIEVVNAGVSGSTSASGRARLEWHLRRKPDILLLALGANDGLRGIEVETTKANLASIIDLAQSNNIAVLLAGMKLPSNYGPAYTKQFESMFRDLAREKEVALLPFLLAGVAGRPDLNLPDGIHPNADGYAIVADTVAKSLVPILRQVSASPRRRVPASARRRVPTSTGSGDPS